MKNKTYRNILGFFLAAMVLLASCEKEDPIKLDAQLETWEISNITSTSADISGFVVAEGDGFAESGICWSTSENPTIDDNNALTDNVDKAVYTAQATGLDHLTSYFVRAYSKSTSGMVFYGKDLTFITLTHVATVSVDDVTDITAATATSGGNVTYDGKADVTAKGVCWSMEEEPTVEGNLTEDGDGLGTFTSALTGLVGDITYYVRAYATNEAGIAYSNQISFKTPVGVAAVSTDSTDNITKTTATAYGNALFTGGADITERGFCWATIENPTIADDHMASGNGLGEFEVDLEGLDAGTEYHIRAYVTNSQGTAYGEDLSFNTIPDEYFLVGSVNGWNNHGLYLANLGNDIHVGYQYLEDGAEFKIIPVRDSWDNAWGRDGDNVGTVVAGGGNIKSIDEPSYTGADFYEIRFDLANGTVVLTPITMGVIGDAQAGSWDTDVTLTYNQDSKKLEGKVDFLATGNYKFRANDDWLILNLGGDLNNLVHNGDNFATPGEGNWNVTLDISGEGVFNATVSQYPNELYMTGDGVGLDDESWNWFEPLQLIPVHSHPELFWKTVWMKGSGSFKFAPQAAWTGGDFGVTGTADADGVYAKGNDNISAPGTAGYYMVVVDMKNNTVQVTEPKVYGIGAAFGSVWAAEDANYLFTVDNDNEVIEFVGVPDDGNLRAHVAATTLACDWWQAEVNIDPANGDIAFRGTGGDPANFPVLTGETISLNFKAGTGTSAK